MRAASLIALISAVACFPAGPAIAPPAILRIPPAVRALVARVRTIDIPAARRKRNWIGDRNQGSCVHAALRHLFHWQGQHEFAEWWGAHHGNGESCDGLAAKLDAAGVRYAQTTSGEENFLEWAIRTRRGAAVVVQNGAHMVNLVGLDASTAKILDSNDPGRIQTFPRASFLRDWKQSGGWAITPVGVPGAPPPWIVRENSPEGVLK